MGAADSGEGSVREGDIELGEIVNSDGLLGGNLSGLTGPRTVSHSCFEKEVAERATWSRHGYQRPSFPTQAYQTDHEANTP